MILLIKILPISGAVEMYLKPFKMVFMKLFTALNGKNLNLIKIFSNLSSLLQMPLPMATTPLTTFVKTAPLNAPAENPFQITPIKSKVKDSFLSISMSVKKKILTKCNK
jgi:hypothetical protein